MRYILLLVFTLLFTLPVFADYTPIEKQNREQYKAEINKIINKEIPISKKEIKKVFKEVKKENNQNIKTVLIEQGINSVILEFYIKLINTTEKYVNIKKDIPPTNWYSDIEVVITPYLKDNHVNIDKINSFLNYASKKQLELERKYNY